MIALILFAQFTSEINALATNPVEVIAPGTSRFDLCVTGAGGVCTGHWTGPMSWNMSSKDYKLTNIVMTAETSTTDIYGLKL